MTSGQLGILIKVGFVLGGALMSFIPNFIAYLRAKKKAKIAKTEEEKQLAEADMTCKMKELIASAEKVYEQVDIVLKKNGDTAGPLKKDTVLSKLIAYASSKGYAFDEEVWSKKIDKEVKYTREVNSK